MSRYTNLCIFGFCCLLLCTNFFGVAAQGRYTNKNCGFPCKSPSAGCINEHLKCDGKADCADGSDETLELCSNIHCPKFAFRCNYGACVNKRARCNGDEDCLDGSDEKSCTDYVGTSTTNKLPSQKPISCLLPNDPDKGVYAIGGSTASDVYGAGASVPPYSVLITICNDGYHASPPESRYSVCANGIWTPVPATCSDVAQSAIVPGTIKCECHC